LPARVKWTRNERWSFRRRCFILTDLINGARIALFTGAKCVFVDRFLLPTRSIPASLPRDVLVGVPAIVPGARRNLRRRCLDLGSLRTCFSAGVRCRRGIFQNFESRFGLRTIAATVNRNRCDRPQPGHNSGDHAVGGGPPLDRRRCESSPIPTSGGGRIAYEVRVRQPVPGNPEEPAKNFAKAGT